jgi:uncharacterized UPF0160 family protein
MKKNISSIRSLVTHAGKFHADDVFSTALLILAWMKENGMISEEGTCSLKSSEIELIIQSKLVVTSIDLDGMNPKKSPKPEFPTVYRFSQVPSGLDKRPDVLVYDIGFGDFDHHQPDTEVRPNGIKYAAFGLLFREFGTTLIPDENEVSKFDRVFVQLIDETDNTGAPNPVSAFISTFMSLWNEPSDPVSINEAFKDAVLFAVQYLFRFFEKMMANVKAAKKCETFEVREGRGGKILVMDCYVPHNMWSYNHGIKVAVYPSLRGGYSASVISDEQNRNICLFPKEWRGKNRFELAPISKIPTLHFCHNSGFMIATDSLEDAIEAAQYVTDVTYED